MHGAICLGTSCKAYWTNSYLENFFQQFYEWILNYCRASKVLCWSFSWDAVVPSGFFIAIFVELLSKFLLKSTKDFLPTLSCTRHFLWMSIVFFGIFPVVAVGICRRDYRIHDRVSTGDPSGVSPIVLPGVLTEPRFPSRDPRLLDLLENFQDNLIEASRTNSGRDSARHFGRHPGKRSMSKYWKKTL